MRAREAVVLSDRDESAVFLLDADSCGRSTLSWPLGPFTSTASSAIFHPVPAAVNGITFLPIRDIENSHSPAAKSTRRGVTLGNFQQNLAADTRLASPLSDITPLGVVRIELPSPPNTAGMSEDDEYTRRRAARPGLARGDSRMPAGVIFKVNSKGFLLVLSFILNDEI